MKLFVSLTLALGFFISSFAQVEFKKGYFIDKNDKKVECLIQNKDWAKAPGEFKYRLSSNGPIETGNTSDIKEFHIEAYGTFRSAEVDVDQSPTAVSQLSNEKNPDWQRKRLFLEVLVDGKATLYFNRSALAGFFYSVNRGEIKQLIRKQYRVDGGSIATNNGFRQQLFTDLICPKANLSIERLEYSKHELTRYFEQYNACIDPNFVAEKKKASPSRQVFNAGIFAGVNATSLSFDYRGLQSQPDADFGTKGNFQLGLDLELILPVQKNKWAITTDIRYQEYKSQYEDQSSASAISLKFARLDLGLRHYFYINTNSKIHLGGTINFFNYLLNGNYEYRQSFWTTSESKHSDFTRSSFRVTPSSLGLGYTYRRVGIDLRRTNYELVAFNTNYGADEMKGFSISAKYTFFKQKMVNR